MSDRASGREGPGDLDPIIHAAARLVLMTHLYVVEAADATFLLNRTGLTWGNLATHLRKLESAGYVDVTKEFVGRRPRTVIAMTREGRAAFDEYRAAMERILAAPPPRRRDSGRRRATRDRGERRPPTDR
jgi:DNA-binding MarR family transcriptional regulator